MPDKRKSASKQSELDRSIDVGLDQFGRFARLRWFWLALVGLVFWYCIVFILPQISPPAPGVVLVYAIQIIFAILFGLMQFVAIFWFLGRPRLYWVMPGETGVTFDDYKGNPEVLEAARRIVRLLRGVKEFQQMGGLPVRGLLLAGDPGTGKSYLAQCMSTEAGVPFAYASAASFRAMFVGMDILMIRRLYSKARRLAREYGACVVFLDEIDAIGASRSRSGGGNMALGGGVFGGMMGTGGLNQLLMEMDPPSIETAWFKKMLRVLGLHHSRAQQEPVLTVGATNLPEALDLALLRPGRFDRRIDVAPPTDTYRPEVVIYYLRKVTYDPAISIPALSQRLVNYTPVAIKHVVNEAVIIAHFDGRDSITYKDLIEAQDVHEYGLRQVAELPPLERRRLAYHETGHTVACYYLMERYFPAFVTLHMHGDIAGATAFAAWRQKETILTESREDVLARIQVALAARAAEELFLDTQLNGVSADLASATELAAQYVGMYGMDGSLTSCAAFVDTLYDKIVSVPNFSERVEAVLQSQFQAVRRLLQEHSEAVIAVAEALSERDELVADEIQQLIDEADTGRVTSKALSQFEALLSNRNGQNWPSFLQEDSLRVGAGAVLTRGGDPRSRPRPLSRNDDMPFATGIQQDEGQQPFPIGNGKSLHGSSPPGWPRSAPGAGDTHTSFLSRGTMQAESASARSSAVNVDTTRTSGMANAGQNRSPRWQLFLFWGAALALLALAVAMRLYMLGPLFDRDSYDEGVYWQTLRAMAAGHALYAQIFYAQPPAFMLSVYPIFASFGGTLWSARLGVAIVSLLGLPGAFLLGKSLAGRLGAIAALLLLIVNPLYTNLSQTLEAEAPSTAFSLLAIALIYLWWENPTGAVGVCLAILTGVALALGILCKLLGVAVAVPIALFVLARLYVNWKKSRERASAPPHPEGAINRAPTHSATGVILAIVALIVAALVTFVAFILPFAGNFSAMYRDVVSFHLVAKAALGNEQSANLRTIGAYLIAEPLLVLAALYGLVVALFRRDWLVLPLLAWFVVTLYLLWAQVPLFPRHMVALAPSLIGLAVMGLRSPLPWLTKSALSRMSGTTLVALLALLLILTSIGLEARQDRAYYQTQPVRGSDGNAQLEARIARDIDQVIAPGQQVITDGQFIAALAGRNTPPSLVDTSSVRITSGYLILQQLEHEAAQPQAHAVLFFSGRLTLPQVGAFHAWIAAHGFHLTKSYGFGIELWAR